ncbi:MAG TPA: SDR family oxidoreductase [Rhizomicrobium sp.]|jgi:NAD(P)-dependent dehydrogenase (short-subunit alcohol dehydrogenase family)|nr:SDR family oxidoreductase [Rhizomicrobium sp.]
MTARPSEPEDRKTLILTGASRGIGHATVKRFSSAGWRVITCSRHAFPENCPWAAGPEDHIQVDLADEQDTLRAVGEMRERLKDGKLHALVNNAGISPKSSSRVHGGGEPRSGGGGADRAAAEGAHAGGRLNTLNTARDVWRQVFEVNFFSTIWLAQGLVAELAAAQGAIVNVTSIAGSRVHPFAGSAYATSKAALAALTREMAADFGPLGVRVNAIAPGEIDTAILSPGTEKIVEAIPLRRLGLPEEVAKAIYYLCTEQSSYVTGAELHINGGQHV